MVGIAGLLLGVVATSGIYAVTNVASLRSDLAVSTAVGLYLQGNLEEANLAMEACQETVSTVADTMSSYADAYAASRDAVDNFFDRYHFAAGDADYLYANLYLQDDSVSSAASTLSSVTDGDLTECVTYLP